MKDYRLLPVDIRTPLDDVLKMLLNYNQNGEMVFVDYGCVKFFCDDVDFINECLNDLDYAYNLVYGMQKDDYKKYSVEVDYLNFGYEYIYPELYSDWVYVVNNRNELYSFDFNDLVCIMRFLEKYGIEEALKVYLRSSEREALLNLIGNFSKNGVEFYRKAFEAEGKKLTDVHERNLKRLEERMDTFKKNGTKRLPVACFGDEEELDDVILLLQKAYNRGEYISYEFKGVVLDNKERPTSEEVYMKVYGCSKEESQKKKTVSV